MIKQTLALVGLTLSLSANAALIEVGDLNIISDAGNASDGLRFLDMSYSVGLSQSAALLNAQATYPNARIATGFEFDDLFAAAGITYSGSETASDGFEIGSTATISTDETSIQGLVLALGVTSPFDSSTYIFTDPDQSTVFGSTRDMIAIGPTSVVLFQSPSIVPNDFVGYLIVSEVPVPAAGWLFMSALLGLMGKKRLSRR